MLQITRKGRREQRNKKKRKQTGNRIVCVNPNISIIMLNVNYTNKHTYIKCIFLYKDKNCQNDKKSDTIRCDQSEIHYNCAHKYKIDSFSEITNYQTHPG
jgi:hypothetical protein